MHVTVTREMLASHSACPKGLSLFDTLAPSGAWSGEWTALHSSWLSRDFGEMYVWCVRRNMLPLFPRDADLRGADLRGAVLRRADLSDADLRDADLRNVDLRGANLDCADMRGVDLSGAIFGDTTMPNGTVRNA